MATIDVASNSALLAVVEKLERQNEILSEGAITIKGDDGKDGVIFTPHVSADGTLSWTNDGGLTNPEPVNIVGNVESIGEIVQTSGDSELAVMSQKATTDLVGEIKDFFQAGINLYDESKATLGKILWANGSWQDNASYNTTDYIPVSIGETLTAQVTLGSTRAIENFRTLVAYDAEKNILADSCANQVQSYTVPDGVSYIRASIRNTYPERAIVCGTDILPYEPCGKITLKPEHHDDAHIENKIDEKLNEFKDSGYIDDKVEKMAEEKVGEKFNNLSIDLPQCTFAERENLFIVGNAEAGYLGSANGSVINDGSGTYLTSEYIKVNPNQSYAFYRKGGVWRFVAEYDASGSFISGLCHSNITTLTTSENTAYIRATVHAVSAETATIVKGDVPNPNASTDYFIPESYIRKGQEDASGILAFLPDEIVCASGRTIEIYNAQVCPGAEKYHFRWVCQVGKSLKRKFSITGTDVLIGEYSLTLEIYNDDLKPVYSKTATLKIVSAALANSYSICPIGDSLTNEKYWLTEVRTLSDNKISYIGTRGTNVGRQHEGRSGFSTDAYLSAIEYTYQGEGIHPFWDSENSCFSWAYYKANTGLNPDAIQIYLGTNDLNRLSPETFANNVKTMVDAIRENDSAIPIFIVLTICSGNQNGLGTQQSTDGYASARGVFKYNQDVLIINGVKALHETLKGYANLHFIPLTQCHDSEYNFGAVETPVNPRATQTEFMPTEGIHPQKQGYEQMADVMFSVYCKVFA